MYHRYPSYPYFGRYPFPYMRFYPTNQIATVNQRIVNFGGMTNVSQNSNILMLKAAPEPEPEPEIPV
jgi:hypothetical protein